MSGAHDIARDAARRLWEAANWDENMLDPPQGLDHYTDEIKTIAQYLGVKTGGQGQAKAVPSERGAGQE